MDSATIQRRKEELVARSKELDKAGRVLNLLQLNGLADHDMKVNLNEARKRTQQVISTLEQLPSVLEG